MISNIFDKTDSDAVWVFSEQFPIQCPSIVFDEVEVFS